MAMSSDTRRRLVLYGLSVVVLAGLGYGGFVYQADADFDTLIGNAEALANYGQPKDAIEIAEQALAERPDHRYAHIIIAHSYTRMGEFDRAVTYYRRAVDLTPLDDQSRDSLVLYFADSLAQAGKVEDAVKEIDGVLERSPSLLDAYVVKASICHAEGDSATAKAALLAGMKQLPDAHRLPSLLAEIEFDGGEIDAARSHLREAERLAADQSQRLESDLSGLENMPEADSLRAEAAALTKSRAGISLGLARVYASEGDQKGAEREVLAAAALDRRLTAVTVHTDKILKPLVDVPEVAAGLKGTASNPEPTTEKKN
jgi:tetratricopeptide (TPR) repeat protein